jgi:hypothetical protein
LSRTVKSGARSFARPTRPAILRRVHGMDMLPAFVRDALL